MTLEVAVREALDARPVEGYCDDCSKIQAGRCSVYSNPTVKTAALRGGHIGCAFSPVEHHRWVDRDETKKKRVGQQKGKVRRK